MALTEIGGMVNDILNAGFRFDWPGMMCEEHPGGRAVALFHATDVNNPYTIPYYVIPCQTDEDEIIRIAYDILTYPGGRDKYAQDHYAEAVK